VPGLHFVIAACGLWGLSGSLFWSFAKTRRTMLAVLIATQPGWILHWGLQHDATAAWMSVLSLLLTVLSAAIGGKPGGALVRWGRRAFLLALVPVVIICAFTWNGWLSAFASTGMAVGCLARWQADGSRFRRLLLATSLPWLAHDALGLSAPAVASDLFSLARGCWLEWSLRRAALPKRTRPQLSTARQAAA
jgi:hypothetical protein